jgi:hypothetical protein
MNLNFVRVMWNKLFGRKTAKASEG